jgi:cysteinyl-tRNA synthetase
MINIDGEKMSKSLGNFWTISDALERVDPLVLRYTLINAPYRQPVDFNQVMIDDSENHHNRLLSCYGEGLSKYGNDDWSGFPELVDAAKRLEEGMNDDFNTRVALVEVQAVAKWLRGLLNSGGEERGISGAVGWISEFAGEVLGLLPTDEEVLARMESHENVKGEVAPKVEGLLRERENARYAKDWVRADEIRDELAEMGVVVEDGPDGATWRIE